MAWYDRPTTAYERNLFSRLREVYLILRRWSEQVPELPLRPIEAFEHASLPDALDAENAQELLEQLRDELHACLQGWEQQLKSDGSKRSAQTWGRLLRLTESEAVSYTSNQWKDSGDHLFRTVPEVFAAYRESPFATLYRHSIVTLASRPTSVEFMLEHPALEIESAWMRGFTTALRPQIQIQIKEAPSRMKTFQWNE